MEGFKEKIPMIMAAIVVIILLVGAVYVMFIKKDIYYTKIDNSKIEQVSTTDDMKYQYTLPAYDKTGKEKEIQFKTSRELREDAYLQMEIMTIRGVISWEEIQEDNLPDKVKEKIDK